jgi:hypothetical protein
MYACVRFMSVRACVRTHTCNINNQISAVGHGAGRADDIDREVVLLMKNFDETLSWYFHNNIERYTAGKDAISQRCRDDGEEVRR